MMAMSLLSVLVAAQNAEERTQAYIDSNRLTDHHQIFASMTGDWTAVQKVFADADAPPLESDARGTGTLRFGGRFLFLEVEGKSMGRDVTVLTIIGYDVFKREYLAVAVGENGTTMYSSRGSYDPETGVLVLRGEMDDAFGKRPVRYTFRFEDEDTFVFDAYDTRNAEEKRVVEITYRRRKARTAGVTGIGGIFFKARDTEKLRAWYEKHLGVAPQNESAFESKTVAFRWHDPTGYTVWGPFPEDTTYFDPSKASFMINYRVDDLDALLEALRKEGVEVEDRVEEYPYGRFGWIMDPEGNRIELWEPATGR